MQYTQEQIDDIKHRSAEADKEIKTILDNYELSVKALPAFQEIEGGRCVAIGTINYHDLKYSKPSTLEVETPEVTDVLPSEDAAA